MPWPADPLQSKTPPANFFPTQLSLSTLAQSQTPRTQPIQPSTATSCHPIPLIVFLSGHFESHECVSCQPSPLHPTGAPSCPILFSKSSSPAPTNCNTHPLPPTVITYHYHFPSQAIAHHLPVMTHQPSSLVPSAPVHPSIKSIKHSATFMILCLFAKQQPPQCEGNC